MMDLVFCGTPQFAVPTLRALLDHGFSIRLVVTQPDRPSGRGLELSSSPVKQLALERGLPITQPDRIKNNQEFRAQLDSIQPAAIVVVGYGRIIPQWMIDLPPLGNINLHASLLPKYRGAAPIQWAIAMGETVAGVTTMRIDAGLDTGDILLQRQLPIAPEDTAVTLAPRLAEIGAELMVETLPALEQGKIQPHPQDHSQSSLAPILKKEDGLIDFQMTATEICNRLRGFQPWPGIFTIFRGKHLTITAARPLAKASVELEPALLKLESDRLLVGCGGSTAIELLEVQPEGKKRMSIKDFINGYRPKPAEKLGQPATESAPAKTQA
ncbi:MAG TPA: methionyl-tRNA formyltransferase [Terriglobales bacterium]|nr:methionyl-tRNA formyltransferase [Terriglobales bacterium]